MGKVVSIKCKASSDIDKFINSVPQEDVPAWYVLFEAQLEWDAMVVAKERAAAYGFPRPISLSDYLMWIEKEIEFQEEWSDTLPELRREYAKDFQRYAMELRKLGVLPTVFEKEKGQYLKVRGR